MRYYFVGIFLGVDILFNSILGGTHYQTISCRIGISILTGGWASKISLPSWLKAHFIHAVRNEIV